MDQTTLLLARSFAVVAGGLFSWSLIDLVVSGNIRFYLADQKFSLLVLIGGVLLGLIVVLKIRALALWGAAGAHHHHDAHDHSHAHPDPAHEHEHASHDHEPVHSHAHGHGHPHHHGVSLWRYFVLFVPLIIILMGLKPRGLSARIYEQRMSKEQVEAIAAVGNATLPEGRVPHGDVRMATVKELQEAAQDPSQRDVWESTTRPIRARTWGQFIPDRAPDGTLRYSNRYRLMRIKITCCAADATPVGIAVMGAIDHEWVDSQWLEVMGPVSFLNVTRPNTRVPQYFTVIHQQQVERIPQPPDLYLQ